jgi:DNA processing protein
VRLFETLLREGLVLSEFAPGTPPRSYHFPHRNRIIAFLSDAVLVVEAAAKSGSLITAGRAGAHTHIMAVPGPLGRPTSEGCNQLIRSGAELVTTGLDVLESLKLTPAPEVEGETPAELAGAARVVWQTLSNHPMHMDEIALRAGQSVPAVTHLLLELELAGRVNQLPGSRFTRRPTM